MSAKVKIPTADEDKFLGTGKTDFGLNNKTIARKLGISDTTVKVHIKHMLSKLKLTSRLEAAVWAHKQK